MFKIKIKILGMPSFGGEVKPLVSCRKWHKKASFRQNYQTPFLPTVPPFVIRSAHGVGDVEASGSESGNV
jgi:hypothetical protein